MHFHSFDPNILSYISDRSANADFPLGYVFEGCCLKERFCGRGLVTRDLVSIDLILSFLLSTSHFTSLNALSNPNSLHAPLTRNLFLPRSQSSNWSLTHSTSTQLNSTQLIPKKQKPLNFQNFNPAIDPAIMAPTPLQQRQTHNTLLFQKLLSLREGASPFTLILDTLEQSGRAVVREFVLRGKVGVEFFFSFFLFN